MVIGPSALILQSADAPIPEAVIEQLNAAYPGWQFHQPDPMYGKHTDVCDPNTILGDFNGDGRPDYAILTVEKRPGEESDLLHLWAFLSDGDAYSGIQVESIPDNSEIFLCRWERGRPVHDYNREAGEMVVSQNDGFNLVADENGAICFHLVGSDFQPVACSD